MSGDRTFLQVEYLSNKKSYSILSVAIHSPMNPHSDVVLFLSKCRSLLCIIVTNTVKFDNVFSLQSYQLERGSHHVQVTIQMLNKPDLQVLLATIVVAWSVEAYYQAVMLLFMKEYKFCFVI